jgi:hypothetical protein
VAAEELDKTEASENVIYISDYIDKKTLDDSERIVLAFAGNIEEMLLKD